MELDKVLGYLTDVCGQYDGMDELFQSLSEVLEVEEDSLLFFLFDFLQRDLGLGCNWGNI